VLILVDTDILIDAARGDGAAIVTLQDIRALS
jgi:hypothetical protein